MELRRQLVEVSERRRFILQGGDCAERFQVSGGVLCGDSFDNGRNNTREDTLWDFEPSVLTST